MNGKFEIYSNKKLKLNGAFINGLPNGIFLKYSKNGVIYSELRYENGKLLRISFYKNKKKYMANVVEDGYHTMNLYYNYDGKKLLTDTGYLGKPRLISEKVNVVKRFEDIETAIMGSLR